MSSFSSKAKRPLGFGGRICLASRSKRLRPQSISKPSRKDAESLSAPRGGHTALPEVLLHPQHDLFGYEIESFMQVMMF